MSGEVVVPPALAAESEATKAAFSVESAERAVPGRSAIGPRAGSASFLSLSAAMLPVARSETVSLVKFPRSHWAALRSDDRELKCSTMEEDNGEICSVEISCRGTMVLGDRSEAAMRAIS